MTLSLKRITVFLAAIATLVAATAANAQVRQQREYVTRPGAIDDMSQVLRSWFNPYRETVRVGQQGRRDQVLHTRGSFDEALHNFKNAYATNKPLPGGMTCGGYFVVPDKRLATITLYLNGDSYMVMLEEAPGGMDVVVWGFTFNRTYSTPPRVRSRPYHRGYPTAPRRRFRL